MVWPADQRVTIIEKIECYSQFPRRAGVHHITQDQRDSTRVIQGANRLRRKEVQKASL